MDHARHVAVGDEADRGAGGADLGHHLLMPGAFEDADGQVARRAALGPGQRLDPFRRAHLKADDVFRQAGTDGELVHIDVGRVQKGAARGHGDDGQRVRHVLGGQRRAFQRVKRDVHLRPVAAADLFADVKHRRLVAFALADDDDALDVEKVELVAHRVDGGLVGGLFVAAPDQAGRGMGGRLADTGKAQRQHAVEKFLRIGHNGLLTSGLQPE